MKLPNSRALLFAKVDPFIISDWLNLALRWFSVLFIHQFTIHSTASVSRVYQAMNSTQFLNMLWCYYQSYHMITPERLF
jgi:hypothetical protein